MKVVLFCGGAGMRLRDYSEKIPKPLVEVGPRPILWHLMSYYARYGHTDFVLCLGHGGAAIKEYFLKYDECASNDFVLSEGGRKIELLSRDIDTWRITFVDTGLHATIGQRLMAVREHVAGDEMFLANYSDGLSDVELDGYVDYFRERGKIACFLSVAAPCRSWRRWAARSCGSTGASSSSAARSSTTSRRARTWCWSRSTA